MAIGVLLMPLFLLSHPATRRHGAAKGQPAASWPSSASSTSLSQTELGQIDPTSETIKLATLGMRGVAADILWRKANNYQMKKDWTNLCATLEQISKVQPHFIEPWRYQAWNLSYNVSVSFDDYHDKYYWLIEGINFLKRGVRLNEHEPRLLVGRRLVHRLQDRPGRRGPPYRRLFKEDDDFHGAAAPGTPRQLAGGQGVVQARPRSASTTAIPSTAWRR